MVGNPIATEPQIQKFQYLHSFANKIVQELQEFFGTENYRNFYATITAPIPKMKRKYRFFTSSFFL